MSITMWVMEQELCPECGWLLGYFGECTNPNCIVWEGWDKWDEEDDDNPYYPDFGDYEEQAYPGRENTTMKLSEADRENIEVLEALDIDENALFLLLCRYFAYRNKRSTGSFGYPPDEALEA